jgi:hypothetical protein
MRIRFYALLAHLCAYLSKDCARTAQRFADRSKNCAGRCCELAAEAVMKGAK